MTKKFEELFSKEKVDAAIKYLSSPEGIAGLKEAARKGEELVKKIERINRVQCTCQRCPLHGRITI